MKKYIILSLVAILAASCYAQEKSNFASKQKGKENEWSKRNQNALGGSIKILTNRVTLFVTTPFTLGHLQKDLKVLEEIPMTV